MKSHGYHYTDVEIQRMIKNVGKRSSNVVDFNEFIEMMLKKGNEETDDVQQAFKVFDRDGDGLITADELKLTMNNLGEPLTNAEVKAMIAEADIDGDGGINIQEFKVLMQKKTL